MRNKWKWTLLAVSSLVGAGAGIDVPTAPKTANHT